MTVYNAPTRDMNFVLNELAGLAEVVGGYTGHYGRIACAIHEE